MDFLDALEVQSSNGMSRFVVNFIMHKKRPEGTESH